MEGKCTFCGAAAGHHSAECIDTNGKGYAPAARRLTPDQWRDLVEGKRSFIRFMAIDSFDHIFLTGIQKFPDYDYFVDHVGIIDNPGLWQPWFPEWEGCPLKVGDKALIMMADGCTRIVTGPDDWRYAAAAFTARYKIIAYQVIPKEGE